MILLFFLLFLYSSRNKSFWYLVIKLEIKGRNIFKIGCVSPSLFQEVLAYLYYIRVYHSALWIIMDFVVSLLCEEWKPHLKLDMLVLDTKFASWNRSILILIQFCSTQRPPCSTGKCFLPGVSHGNFQHCFFESLSGIEMPFVPKISEPWDNAWQDNHVPYKEAVVEVVEHCRVFSVFQAPRTHGFENHHLILTHYEVKKTENAFENRSISGNIQGQVGQGSEQPDWVAHCKRIGLCDFISPLHPRLLQSSLLPLTMINYLQRSRCFLMWTKSFTVNAVLVVISRRGWFLFMLKKLTSL